MKKQEKTVFSDLLKQNFESADKPDSINPLPLEEQGKNSGNPKPSPPPSGGPQFGTDKGGWGKRMREWINKYGSSVILPIIALLILAGGIYLYSTQKGEEGVLPSEELAAISEEVPTTVEEEEEALPGEEIISPGEEVEEEIIAPVEEETPEEIIAPIEEEAEEEAEEITIEEIIPEGRKEAGTIVEVAAKGDGVTHLARRALKDYLEDHPQELTNEHKIYIEDYLKDRTGSRPLEVGEEIAFSEDLIKEAIDASLELTPEQLKNLEKYSALVVSW